MLWGLISSDDDGPPAFVEFAAYTWLIVLSTIFTTIVVIAILWGF